MSIVYSIVAFVARLFTAALVVRALLSWIPFDRSSPAIDALLRGLYAVTEPVLGPIRRAIPPLAGLDLSPLIAILLVQALLGILARLV